MYESTGDWTLPGSDKSYRIGITIGDPAGIGPEIAVKALADADLRRGADFVLIGSIDLLRSVSSSLGLSLTFHSLGEQLQENSIAVSVSGVPVGLITPGVESAETGRSAARCIEAAVKMWRNGEIDAIATAPISKHALSLAGYKYPGHTEFLAELTDTKEFAMSFFAGRLRVVLLSTHYSLVDAIAMVRTANLVDLIKFSDAQLTSLLKKKVRLAVAGLNPHASEDGMFGVEEAREIIPAIRKCRESYGIDVSGPFSPDTIFLRGFRGEFDGVIACYHDQATIAVKCLSFGSAVNVTLGLPLIRTSVDHGTAFDIAGKGVADASSMKAALRTAAELLNLSKNPARI